MQDVRFEGNIVHHQPADGREVGLAVGPPAAVAFSVPQRPVWRWPGGPLEETQDVSRNEAFAAGFLDDGGPLEGTRSVRLRRPLLQGSPAAQACLRSVCHELALYAYHS